MSYSGGAANSYTYAVGLLTANPQDDLSNPANWHKSLTPVLHYQSVAGEYGPGHNSFFRDDLGNLWIAFHGEVSYESRERCAGIRRVHFDVDGRPRFNLSANRDVNLALRNVSIHVTVK
ncbi:MULTISPECIES: family 43 glycosylhydrolase [Bifidobacterium]|uniref:family 43 glycosylhydrolase n=1 Tax=Bifidobacterium TaxID=1678 RepID=UPI001E2E9418|nr:family 43 glycosylhydrolase [Bifidobacterium catenulatum]